VAMLFRRCKLIRRAMPELSGCGAGRLKRHGHLSAPFYEVGSVMLSALSACGDAQAGAKHLNGDTPARLSRREMLRPLARTQNDMEPNSSPKPKPTQNVGKDQDFESAACHTERF